MFDPWMAPKIYKIIDIEKSTQKVMQKPPEENLGQPKEIFVMDSGSHLAQIGTVTSPSWEPFASKWASDVQKGFQPPIATFKTTIFSILSVSSVTNILRKK